MISGFWPPRRGYRIRKQSGCAKLAIQRVFHYFRHGDNLSFYEMARLIGMPARGAMARFDADGGATAKQEIRCRVWHSIFHIAKSFLRHQAILEGDTIMARCHVRSRARRPLMITRALGNPLSWRASSRDNRDIALWRVVS